MPDTGESIVGSGREADPGTHLVEIPDQRLVAAVASIVLGGLLVVLQGLDVAGGGGELTTLGVPGGQSLQSLGVFEVVIGLVLVGFAGFLWFEPIRRRAETGFMVLVVAAASLLVGGGFLVGMALCLTGGMIALALPKGPHYMLIPATVRPCQACYSLYESGTQVCPSCGAPLD